MSAGVPLSVCCGNGEVCGVCAVLLEPESGNFAALCGATVGVARARGSVAVEAQLTST